MGDVQPLVAVASRLRALGHDARLCVPPNFVERVRAAGFEAVPVVEETKVPAARSGSPSGAQLTAQHLQRLRESIPDLITDQFDAISRASEGCDVILGANAHQHAARSIAEVRRVPFVAAVWTPVFIPSPDHLPPPAAGESWTPKGATSDAQRSTDNVRAWDERGRFLRAVLLERVNQNRQRRGLAPINDLLRYNITDAPWLAADSILGPVPTTPGSEVFPTGAWILENPAPLSPEIEEFCAKGTPPIYLGSMQTPEHVSRIIIDAVRSVRRRAVISRGLAALDVIDDARDCIAIGDANHQALFKRVAAVVHHGGAGTTATAARAGVPQVVVPMLADQFYWADRIVALELGSSVFGTLTAEALSTALRKALDPATAERARSVARQLGSDGAMVAARRLVSLVARSDKAGETIPFDEFLARL